MNIFKKLRILSAKTIKMVSEETGIHEQCIRAWEKGKSVPREDKLPMLAKAYGCEMSVFLEAYEKKK